jgi:hypothetical protein
MTRFTLKGAAAIIEDHQKSIRELEAENDALKAELDKRTNGLQRTAYDNRMAYEREHARAEKADARVAESSDLLIRWLGREFPFTSDLTRETKEWLAKKEAPRL